MNRARNLYLIMENQKSFAHQNLYEINSYIHIKLYVKQIRGYSTFLGILIQYPFSKIFGNINNYYNYLLTIMKCIIEVNIQEGYIGHTILQNIGQKD